MPPVKASAGAGTAGSSDLDDLRASGLRVTAPRLAVLAAVREGGHPAVEEVGLRARQRVGTVSTQAIYDVLHALTDAGLLRRIEPPASPVRYEARVGDNHHHVICRTCGSMLDVDCATGHAPCLEPSSSAGYAIDEAEIIYWGICPECRGPADAGAVHPPTRREEHA